MSVRSRTSEIVSFEIIALLLAGLLASLASPSVRRFPFARNFVGVPGTAFRASEAYGAPQGAPCDEGEEGAPSQGSRQNARRKAGHTLVSSGEATWLARNIAAHPGYAKVARRENALIPSRARRACCATRFMPRTNSKPSRRLPARSRLPRPPPGPFGAGSEAPVLRLAIGREGIGLELERPV